MIGRRDITARYLHDALRAGGLYSLSVALCFFAAHLFTV